MLHVWSVCTPCCMWLDVIACCWAKFETGQTFQPTTPNISFLSWSPKRSASMLDPFAQLFQHFWGRARSLHMVNEDLWVVSFPPCNAAPTLLGVVASVCTPLPTYTQQCCELLRPFARSLKTLIEHLFLLFYLYELLMSFLSSRKRPPSIVELFWKNSSYVSGLSVYLLLINVWWIDIYCTVTICLILHQMYQGMTEESEYTAWGSIQLSVSPFRSCTAIPNFAQKSSLYLGWKK